MAYCIAKNVFVYLYFVKCPIIRTVILQNQKLTIGLICNSQIQYRKTWRGGGGGGVGGENVHNYSGYTVFHELKPSEMSH